MKLHHGTELREGKEKGESKERGRWKGKITKYGVTIPNRKQKLSY
jgi:hypothetical protein